MVSRTCFSSFSNLPSISSSDTPLSPLSVLHSKAGTGAQSTREAIKLSKEAGAAGADSVICLPPSYFAPSITQDALQNYYEEVSFDDASISLPLSSSRVGLTFLLLPIYSSQTTPLSPLSSTRGPESRAVFKSTLISSPSSLSTPSSSFSSPPHSSCS